MFNSPDIQTLKSSLDGCIQSALLHRPNTHAAIKIQSLLDLTVYIMATRFLEGSVKHIVYNCAVMRGDDEDALDELYTRLKSFNNPEFSNIKELFECELDFDILQGRGTSYTNRDVSYLNEICKNRHRNVHATPDPREWYNTNTKSITDFDREKEGLFNIVKYIDGLVFNADTSVYEYREAV
ncbi:hypothetical protein [Alteromonas lipotrueae]|uniref:hypothetical protein n=1 Tax=Alteromonas lipotrueae TaxID=2803814 RepID=UPI001C4542A4|nr:hypothetical protein [Alteromonas lipotrueae]